VIAGRIFLKKNPKNPKNSPYLNNIYIFGLFFFFFNTKQEISSKVFFFPGRTKIFVCLAICGPRASRLRMRVEFYQLQINCLKLTLDDLPYT